MGEDGWRRNGAGGPGEAKVDWGGGYGGGRGDG